MATGPGNQIRIILSVICKIHEKNLMNLILNVSKATKETQRVFLDQIFADVSKARKRRAGKLTWRNHWKKYRNTNGKSTQLKENGRI